MATCEETPTLRIVVMTPVTFPIRLTLHAVFTMVPVNLYLQRFGT